MKRYLILLLALTSSAYAADCEKSDRHCKEAAELVLVLGYESSVQSFQTSCIEQAKAFSPDVLIQKDPTLFYGITAESPKWPKVIRAYEEYKRLFCGSWLRPALLEAYRDAWAKSLSEEQLASALTYLRSPSGSALAHALPNVYKSVTAEVLPIFNEVGQQAYLQYSASLRSIADE